MTVSEAKGVPAVSSLRPLGHNLLVQPDRCPEATDSGILIPEMYRDTPPMSGIVVRIGNGSQRDTRIRARAIARCLAILHDADMEYAPGAAMAVAKEEIGRYLQAAHEIEPVCRVGERVVFPMEAGHEIILNEAVDEAAVIVPTDSLLAVYEANR